MLSSYVLFRKTILQNKLQSNNLHLLSSPNKEKLMYLIVGIGACGIVYSEIQKGPNDIFYYKSIKKINKGKTQISYYRRIRNTLSYFGIGIGAISALTFTFASKPIFARFINSSSAAIIPLPLSYISLLGLNKVNQSSSISSGIISFKTLLKNALYLIYNSSFALLFSPIVSKCNHQIILKSALLSGLSCGLLSLIGVSIKKCKHLKIGNLNETASSTLFFLGISNIFLKSKAIDCIYLYGGLLFYNGIALYSFKNMFLKARYQRRYDCIVESIYLSVNIVNIFIHILKIVNDYQLRHRT